MKRSSKDTLGARRSLTRLFVVACLASSGCMFGPTALERSHGPYNEAVKLVGEEQLLLNIVRLRYNESTVHLGVGNIAAQYTLGTTAEARPFFAVPNPTGIIFHPFARILPDASVSTATLPTITFSPQDNAETIQNLYTPRSLDGLVFLVESGYPLAKVFGMFISFANSALNAPSASGPVRNVIPEYHRFRRAIELMQILHDRHELHFHREDIEKTYSSPVPRDKITAQALVEAAKNNLEYKQLGEGWVLIRREQKLQLHINPQADNFPEVVELRDLLNLEPGREKYNVVLGSPGQQFTARLREELTVGTRSEHQAAWLAAHGVMVPVDHLASGQAPATLWPDGRVFDWQEVLGGLFKVCSAKQLHRPKSASVAVKYRGYWFYIDDTDQDTKVTFALLLTMSRSNLAGSSQQGPVLTLPVGGR